MKMIRSRLVRYLLTLVLPSAVLCLIFLASLYHEEKVRVRQSMEVAEQLRLNIGARSLGSDIGRIASDVRLMASLPSLGAVMENSNMPAVARFTEDLVALSASRHVYDQLRWIDETGLERVRVDYVQNQPFVVPEDRLQNKSQRYYFIATMQLERGGIYVSPLDLNVEQDRVETPYKPVIRVGMPVSDKFGNPHGIVMANFFGSYLLDKFSDVTAGQDSDVRVNLLNRDGYWLRAPQTVDEWGFMFGRKDSFGTRYPEAWKQISIAEQGQFEDADGLWSFLTVRPLQAGMISHAAESKPLADDEYVWKIVSRIPGEALAQANKQNLGGWIMMTLLFMGALVAGCLVLARAHRRRDMMAESLRALNRRLEEKVRQRTEELRQQAIRDPLTGLFNRRYLDETLPREIHRALREGSSLAVAMLDLDHFKNFNDQWGHEAGDAVLLGVAETLLDGLRASDIACRYGGEELLVVMPGADTDEAVKRISAIACEVRNLGARVMGRELSPVTFSAGVATLPEHGDNAEILVRAADRALYMAKATGRDRVVVARPPGLPD
jgi:diguanylate cyclase